MNFEKALEAMRQGKKVRRKAWDSSVKYAHMNNVRKRVDLISSLSMGFDNNFYNFEDGGLLADDWEIYEEPQKETEMTLTEFFYLFGVIKNILSYHYNAQELERNGFELNQAFCLIDTAMGAVQKQNQAELVFNPENATEKELEEFQEKLKECKIEAEPEKKCDKSKSDKAERNDNQKDKRLLIRNLLSAFFEIIIENEDYFKEKYPDKFDDVIEAFERTIKEFEEIHEEKCKCHCNCSHAVADADLQEKMKQTLKGKFFELAESTTESYSVNIMLDIYRLLYDGNV